MIYSPNQAVFSSSRCILWYVDSSSGGENIFSTCLATQESVFSCGISPGASRCFLCEACLDQQSEHSVHLHTLQKNRLGEESSQLSQHSSMSSLSAGSAYPFSGDSSPVRAARLSAKDEDISKSFSLFCYVPLEQRRNRFEWER